MKDFDLNRFLVGQQFSYDWALKEILAGKKEEHWIWYVFPQLKGLGYSSNSRFYGIDGREEAEAYLKRGAECEASRDFIGIATTQGHTHFGDNARH